MEIQCMFFIRLSLSVSFHYQNKREIKKIVLKKGDRLFPTVRERNGFEIQEKLLNQHFLAIFTGIQSNFVL